MTKQIDKDLLRSLEAERFERRLRSLGKQKEKNRKQSQGGTKRKAPPTSKFSRPSPIHAPAGEDDRLYLEVPKVLDIVTNYDETAEFIRDIQRAAIFRHRPVTLLFDNAERIRPAALLLLLAEVHRCRLQHGKDRVTGTYPKNPTLERLLSRTGFYQLLGVVSKAETKDTSYPVEYIKFRSDNKLNTSEPKRLRMELLGESITMHPKVRARLYRAITEAMINVGQHAYPKYSAKAHPVRKRWWLAGQVNKRKKELLITFCDLGVGIPETLPRIYTWERIRSVLSLLPGIRPDDGQMIRAGMTIGRSRTKEEHRGRGLNDLRSFIDQANAGELHIFSRKGHYRYRAGGDEETFNSNVSMNGTLIKWSVPLDRVTDWVGDIYETDGEN